MRRSTIQSIKGPQIEDHSSRSYCRWRHGRRDVVSRVRAGEQCRKRIRNGGEPALLLGIIMREGHNGLDLGVALDREVGAINADMPLGMSLTKVTDQAVNISAAVDEFMLKFFAALLVVMLVSFVSMGWRAGLVVARSLARRGVRILGLCSEPGSPAFHSRILRNVIASPATK